MPHRPSHLTDEALGFMDEWQLATVTTIDAAGTPHVVPVGFTWDAAERCARVITGGSTRKVANAALGHPVVLCQVDRARWLSLRGRPEVLCDRLSVADGEQRYARRYGRHPRPSADRVVLLVRVEAVTGSQGMLQP